jgi:hypothetical protein
MATKRPLAVTIVAWVFIVTGTGGFISHGIEIPKSGLHPDTFEAELVELIAIICGAYMLRGHNWARWMALAWIGFHVILSAFSNLREFAVHAVFFILIARLLFRAEATEYFRGVNTDGNGPMGGQKPTAS